MIVAGRRHLLPVASDDFDNFLRQSGDFFNRAFLGGYAIFFEYGGKPFESLERRIIVLLRSRSISRFSISLTGFRSHELGGCENSRGGGVSKPDTFRLNTSALAKDMRCLPDFHLRRE
jgi:hypothetical protein